MAENGEEGKEGKEDGGDEGRKRRRGRGKGETVLYFTLFLFMFKAPPVRRRGPQCAKAWPAPASVGLIGCLNGRQNTGFSIVTGEGKRH